jgi:nucleoside-diphosphate-sugar epimerase
MTTHPIIAEDIRGVLSRTQSLWPDLKGASVLITGATGFFGIWLLETLLAANREFSLGCRVIALSRNPQSFASQLPHLAHDPAVTRTTGDVRDFAFPSGPVTHVIHAATESSTNLNASDPQTMFDVCVDGTSRVLALASEKKAQRLLFTSSGAIYGQQPTALSHVPETFRGGPDLLDRKSAYAEGKRAAEFLCGLAANDGRLSHVAIARCFAFVGPHLPLDVHFAIGNFIRDAITGGPIRVNGDGTPFRSYLYSADLAEWLLTILLRGRSGAAYNVGSEQAMSIRDLAERVATVAEQVSPERPRCQVAVSLSPQPDVPPSRYVPCSGLAREELGLRVSTPLDTAIRRTFLWHTNHS